MGHRAHGTLLCVLLLATAGCGGTADRVDTAQESAAPARRVVSLIPSVTEIFVELGATERLAARTDSDDAPALAHLPSVGGALSPSLEVLAASEPDLVIAWSGSDVSALERVVSEQGRVRTTSVDRLDDIPRAIGEVGAWIGEAARAGELKRRFRSILAAVERPIPEAERPSVLWVVWSEPIVVAGPETFLDDIIAVAGGRNAVAETRSEWPQLGVEPLFSLDPDIVVWPDGPGMFPREQLGRRMPWSLLASVGANRVISVEAQRFHVPGPRIAAAVLDFANLLAQLEQR